MSQSAIPSPVLLTQRLLSFNTSNPPGNEEGCIRFIGGLLEDGGFEVIYHELAPGRPNLVARLEAEGARLPLCFSGHVDTVPFNESQWEKSPLGTDIIEGKLFGRGASDMKAGVAAMVAAALRLAALPRRSAGITLVITAGEEKGCEGAQSLVDQGIVAPVGALILGEPTSNYPMVGHKGVVWLEGTTTGVAAHASTPEKGDNAIYKAARAVTTLEKCFFEGEHPLMGTPTLSVGMISGGAGINVVPDRARFTVDVRTIPGLESSFVYDRLRQWLAPDVAIRVVLDAPSVFSDPEDSWIQEIFRMTARIVGEPVLPRCVMYFTDASVLKSAMGNPPTLILGPGAAFMAHKIDEFCYISKIEEAAAIYFSIGRSWIGV